MTPTTPEVQKVLRRAAEILDGGWCQGNYAVTGRSRLGYQFQMPLYEATPGVDSFCLTGAIMKAVQEHEGIGHMDSGFLGMHPMTSEAFKALHPVLPAGELTHWNDFICPSGDVASAKLREAADALDR